MEECVRDGADFHPQTKLIVFSLWRNKQSLKVMSTLIFSTEYFLHLCDERKPMLAYQWKHSLGEAVLQRNVQSPQRDSFVYACSAALHSTYPVMSQSYQVSS